MNRPPNAFPLAGMARPPAPVQQAQQNAPVANLVWSTIGEQATDSGLKTLVYGQAGVGKTVLCATLPLPIVFVNAESGALSLREQNLFKIFVEHHGMHPDLATDRAKAVAKSPSVLVRNGAELRRVHEDLVRNPGHYASLALDSLSEIAEAMLASIIPTTTNLQKAYGEMAATVDEFVRKFRNGLVGKHVCFTAKMEPMKDEVTGIVKWGPSFPGQQLGKLSPYWLDETFFMGVWTDPANQLPPQRYLLTQPDQNYTAKDRSGALDVMERPDLSYIIDKITNS